MTQESSSSPFQNPLYLPFKPYVPQHLFINRRLPSPSNKKLYKYVHDLQISDELDLNPKTARIKTLTALKMEINHFYFMGKPLKLHILKKFIKPRHKSLRMLKEDLKKPELIKLLPLLSEIRLNQEDFAWRLFASRLKFYTVSINTNDILFHAPSIILSQENILSSYAHVFQRAIPQLQALENLHLTLYLGRHDNLELITNIFQKIDFSAFRLKNLYLRLLSGRKWSDQTPITLNPVLKNLSRYATQLKLNDTLWFASIFNDVKFENLSFLDIDIYPAEQTDFSSLSTLGEIKTLKELHMTFQANSVKTEEKFLELFRLPDNVEIVHLTLVNFQWDDSGLTLADCQKFQSKFDNDRGFVQFFEQWRKPKQLKTLNLTIYKMCFQDNRCPGLAGSFVAKIVRQVKTLESVSYTHSFHELSVPECEKKSPPAEMKFFDLEGFWKALEPSKKNLKSIAIDASDVTFPTKIDSLDNQFPSLEGVSIERCVKWSRNLSYFWKGFQSMKRVVIREPKWINYYYY